MEHKARIAVLVSGGGTNLQALIDAQNCGSLRSGKLQLVISNNASAFALRRAERAGIPNAVILKKQSGGQEGFEAALIAALEAHKIDLIVLAGFLSILSEDFTSRYPKRILNVHPSLIPAFCGKGYYGLRVHEEALKYGVKVTGATVHFVNEVPDGGEIILQKAVEVQPGDTPELLQRRVMEQAEWKLLPEAVELVSKRIISESKKERPMNIYKIHEIAGLIEGNSYVGRGIILGKSADGKQACAAYFIMGRSNNSRNRVFTERNGEVFTEPFDASKVEDPSLIIYAAIRQYENQLIVTNGNQTDTIYEGLAAGKSFREALESRQFEPDYPNLTPRISGMIRFDGGDFTYEMSILKSADEKGTACNRYTFSYPALPGLGHFLHTYVCDGNPIPTFQGEPERVAIPNDIDAFTEEVWNALDADNKISLYVRYIDLATGKIQNRLINKNH